MNAEQNKRHSECFEPTRHIYARYSNLFLVLMVISIILVQRGVVVGGYVHFNSLLKIKSAQTEPAHEKRKLLMLRHICF